jgi:hypothetical protein
MTRIRCWCRVREDMVTGGVPHRVTVNLANPAIDAAKFALAVPASH